MTFKEFKKTVAQQYYSLFKPQEGERVVWRNIEDAPVRRYEMDLSLASTDQGNILIAYFPDQDLWMYQYTELTFLNRIAIDREFGRSLEAVL